MSLILAANRGKVQAPSPIGGEPSVGSLRFYGNDNGNGTTFIDRVRIPIDAPEVPADIGGADFTVELWLRTTSGNNAAAITPGANYSWINGNIFFDRDRFNLPRCFGASLTAGRITFGVNESNNVETWRGSTDIRDGLWHWIVIQRALSTGAVQIYVDGTREVNDTAGPTGDISFPNGAGGGLADQDDYLVLGAEKHDADPSQFPSYFGYMSELRLSDVIRYSGASISVPTTPLGTDADMLALYRFAEGTGSVLGDELGDSDGELRLGGTANGPTWETTNPYE